MQRQCSGIFLSVLATLVLAVFPVGDLPARAVKTANTAGAKRKPRPTVDWTEQAVGELSKTRVSTKHEELLSEAAKLPTPATVRAEVAAVRPAVQRTAIRLGVFVESYGASGQTELATGDVFDYSNLPRTPLVQVDLRWLAFGESESARVVGGGYAAVGYTRQSLPFVAPSGFRYDDVRLNVLRYELGGAVEFAIDRSFGVECRLGVGQLSQIQTSQYSEFNQSYQRAYGALAVDLTYRLTPKLAAAVNLTGRTPVADGSGAMVISPFTVAGGLLVQLR